MYGDLSVMSEGERVVLCKCEMYMSVSVSGQMCMDGLRVMHPIEKRATTGGCHGLKNMASRSTVANNSKECVPILQRMRPLPMYGPFTPAMT